MYFDDNKTEANHGYRSFRGGVVSITARVINVSIQIGSALFLARLLSPEDYGLVSMVAAVTGFAVMLVDLGTRDAIVQRPHITEGEISALFWITLAIGCGLALLVAACGPVIAWFYGEPRLTMITAVSAVTFITAALTCQHYALLRRAMKFHDLGGIEIVANLLSAVIAITIAISGLHYWALVARPIATTSLLAVGLWVRCRWVPGKPTMTTGVKEMVRFGLHGAGFTFSDASGKSVDRVVIGYRNGPQSLGYYQHALFMYEALLDTWVGTLHAVAVSSLTKLQGDLTEFRRLWSKALSTLAFYSMPAFGLLSVISPDLVVLLLGPKWSKAGVLLSILALRGIPHTLERTMSWLHLGAGRSDRWMRYGVVAACAQVVALFSGLPFGLTGVATAYVICMFILFVPAIAYAGRPLGIGATDVIKVVWRQLAGAMIAVAIGFMLRFTLLAHVSGTVRTAALILVFAGLYLVIVVGVLRVRMPIGVVLQLIRGHLPARFEQIMRTPSFIDRHKYEHI